MLSKTTVIETIKTFPENFSLEDLVDEMILLDKIERGISDADNGNVKSDSELDKIIRGWSK